MTFSRRSLVRLVAAAPVLIVTPRLAFAQSPPVVRAGRALPAVDMEGVLKAAQWDPVKVDQGVTTGAGPSVKLVEAALRDRGLLQATYVDGHFGTRTVAAYSRWQKSLGFSGIDASGLPGRMSLTALGESRFSVARPFSCGARTTHQGHSVNARTLAMFKAAQSVGGLALVVEQGSYAPGADPTSAGTHDGGGALDLDAEQLTTSGRTAAVTALPGLPQLVGTCGRSCLRTPWSGACDRPASAIRVGTRQGVSRSTRVVATWSSSSRGLRCRYQPRRQPARVERAVVTRPPARRTPFLQVSAPLGGLVCSSTAEVRSAAGWLCCVASHSFARQLAVAHPCRRHQ